MGDLHVTFPHNRPIRTHLISAQVAGVALGDDAARPESCSPELLRVWARAADLGPPEGRESLISALRVERNPGTETRMQRTADRAIVLDVRTEEEWKVARYEGALLIPHSELEARAREVIDAADGDLTRPVVIFCRSGRRADLARTVLEAQGFTRVTNAGGLVDLCPACMP